MDFLKELSQYYEIVIFTAGMEEYADWVLNQLDTGDVKLIQHRLYRQHTINQAKEGPIIVKDLSKLGRPLDKMIIVDNLAENFILQKDNGIFIETWLEDTSDTQLRDMIPLLKQLVVNNVKDVRVSLRSFRDQMARLISTGNGNALPPIE